MPTPASRCTECDRDRITGLAKEHVQHNYQTAENKKDRQQKPLSHLVLHRAAIHDILAVRLWVTSFSLNEVKVFD
jgi:hypothetical protein